MADLDLTEFGGSAPQLDLNEFSGAKPKGRGAIRQMADLGLSVAKGVVAVPEAAVGLADLVTGGQAGKAAERAGVRFKDAKDVLTGWQSDELKAKQQEFSDAEGVIDKAGVALSNPSLIANTVAESVPLMGAGAVPARALLAAAPRVGAAVAGAAGEGAVGAGSAAEAVRQQTDDGLLTGKQTALAAGSGAATAGFGAIGGLAARRLGLGDVDTMLAQGGRQVVGGAVKPKGTIRRIAEGAAAEGVLEELPQSLSEQALQNVALDKPITEGLADAAVMGTLAGNVMGGAAGAAGRSGFGTKPAVDTATGLSLASEPAATQPASEADQIKAEGYVGKPLAGFDPANPNAARPLRLQDTDQDGIEFTPPVPTPAEEMGLDASAGPMSASAVQAVNSGLSQSMAADKAAQAAAEAQAKTPKAKDETEGTFKTSDEARKYISGQKRAGGASIQALPLPKKDGSYGIAIKGTPDYEIAAFADKQETLRKAGVLDGDVLTKAGDIFPPKQRGLAAITAKRQGAGFEVAPVAGGFVVRKVEQSKPAAHSARAPAATEKVANPVSKPAGKADAPTTKAVENQPQAPAAKASEVTPEQTYQQALAKIQAEYEADPNAIRRDAAKGKAKKAYEAAQKTQPKEPPAQSTPAPTATKKVANKAPDVKDTPVRPRGGTEAQAEAAPAQTGAPAGSEPEGPAAAGATAAAGALEAAGVDRTQNAGSATVNDDSGTQTGESATQSAEVATKAPASAVEPEPEKINIAPPAQGGRAPAATDSIAAKPGKIDDSGAVLEGARKLYAKAYFDKLEEGMAMDIAAVPLSKSWPEPDYQRMLDDGADPWAVAFARAARDEIPNKPSKPWKVKGWVDGVQLLRQFAGQALDGKLSKQRLQEAAEGFHLKDWFNKIDLYEAVGHENSLKGLKFTSGSYSFYAGQKYSPSKVLWTVNQPSNSASATWRSGNWGRDIVVADTKAEAIDKFKAWVAAQGEKAPAQAKGTTFDIYTIGSKPGVIIGKRLSSTKSIDLKTFPDVKAAREYKAANQAELEKLLEAAKFIPAERRDTNAPRVGADHRNGADVTTEQFRETFGFRGEQFGASMPQSERQANLNQAYDALMDLASVIGVPPKALSLNGELGLAFGSRGRGGKNAPAAHYEQDTTGKVAPNRVVINLTRRNGAGSLGHEWWHGVDNYFARMRGEKAGFVTSRPVAFGEGLRPEMLEAFSGLMKTINLTGIKARSQVLDDKRSKAYWTTGLEMAARSFESYVIAKLQDQNASNDYLANVVNETLYALQGAYPYPSAGEMPAIRAAFDHFFDTVITKETDQGVALQAAGFDAAAFAQNYGPAKGMTVEATKKVVDRVGAKWKNGPRIIVVGTTADLPDNVRARVGKGARGVYTRDAVFVIAKNNTSADWVARTLAHEVIAHEGLRGLLGQQGHVEFMKRINDGVEKGDPLLVASRDFVRRAYAGASLTPKQEADEIAAHVVEMAVDPVTGEFNPGYGWLKMVFARVRAFLRNLGVDINFTHLDLQGMLVASMKNLESGQKTQGGGELVVAAARDGKEPTSKREAALASLSAQFKEMTGDNIQVAGTRLAGREVRNAMRAEGNAAGTPATLTPEPFPYSDEAMAVHDRWEAMQYPSSKFLFHTTPAANLESIAKTGLVAGSKQRFEGVSDGRISLAANEAVAKYYGGSDDVLLRVAKGFKPEGLEPDLLSGGDGAYLASQNIPPEALEVKRGRKWVPLKDDVLAAAAIDQTDTPAFKKWFGDSKVVDDAGKPKVMYHGTPFDIKESLMPGGSAGGAIFVTADPQTAAEYTKRGSGDMVAQPNIMPLYVSAKNPFDYENSAHRKAVAKHVLENNRTYTMGDGQTALITSGELGGRDGRTLYTEGVLDAGLENPDSNWIVTEVPEVQAAIKALGHDGFYVSENGGKNLGVYKSSQLKSAIGNNGDFDGNDADILMALGEPSGADRLADMLKATTVTDVKRAAGNKLADYRNLGLQFLGGRQINDLYADDIPQLPEYTRMVQQMSADANEVGANADTIATNWGKLVDERQLAELMHDATLAQIDPAKDFVKGDNRIKWAQLNAQYKALTPEAQNVYRMARNGYEEHYAEVRDAIREKIQRSDMAQPAKAAMLERMDGEFFEKIKGVYFPLSRFGKYVVVTKGPDGKAVSVSRAETLNEAEALRTQMRKDFPADKGYNVGKVIKDKEFNAARDSVGRGFLKELFGVLDQEGVGEELQDAVNQLYLASMPDLSWAKHGIHRKGTPGFSQDARRAYAQNMFHGARYLAKLRYADQLQEKLVQMQKYVEAQANNQSYDSVKGQQIVDEVTKRNDSLMNPKGNPLSTALTSFGFVFHLGLSPASAMVNLSQTALVAYPIMGAKWGFDKAAAALAVAGKQAATNKNDISAVLDGDERRAYDEAVRAGTIDVTNAHDLAGIAQGEDAKVSWKLRPVMKWASFLFHHAERFNRQITFVASYRLAREAGADHGTAFEQATKATYDGHFDYSASNRPRVMQGNAAKVLLLFKQYGQNMVYTLARQAQQAMQAETPEGRKEARKALGGLLAMHAAAAGGLGLPMVSTLLAAASMLGGSDDEPWDAETALRNMLADAFGQKPAEVMARGFSRLTPWDISGRVGLDKLILPDLQEGLEGQRLAESAMAAALGPVAGIGINVLKGMQEIGEGRFARGIETMMPAALRGPVKALRYAEEGAKDKSGVAIKDEVSAGGIAGQALGFSPSEVRNATEGRSAIYQADQKLQARRKELLDGFAKAKMAGDVEGEAEARAEIAAFNEKNPGRRINGLQLVQSVRRRQARIDQAKEGVYLPKNRRDSLAAGQFAAGE